MRNFILLSLGLLLILSGESAGQDLHSTHKKAVKAFNLAIRYFDQREDDLALDQSNKAIKADEGFVEAYMLKAQILKDKGKFGEAITSYKKALFLDPDFFPEGYMVLASVQAGIGDYKEARNNVNIFLNKKKFSQITESDALSFLEKLRFAIRAVQSPVAFSPVNLGDSVNSPLNEYWPSLSLDESRIYFTVRVPDETEGEISRTGGQEDFYFSEKDTVNTWSKRKYAKGFLNSLKNEGAQSLSANGKTLYFTACDRMDGFGKCDLYVSYLYNGNWSNPLNLGGIVNSAHSDKHPSISADQKELYFASDRPGGKGGLDIWLSRKNEFDQWTDPVNLGDSINTSGNEQSPFIHPDNQSLYFSSEGHQNMGRGDIFVSVKKQDNHWSKPKNLGYPINTHHDEVGLIVNPGGDRAYYASDREPSRGLDIYCFDLPEEVRPVPVSYIKGRVFDSETYIGIQARFQLTDLKTGKIIIEEESREGQGMYLVPIPVGTDYSLTVSHPGYLFYSDHFELQGVHEISDPYIRDVPLQPIVKGNKTILNNIFFAFDKAELRKESETELMKIYRFLSDNPGLYVRISGHTDNLGSNEYNQDLSNKRAKAVVDFLIHKGISADRLEYHGYGSGVPIDDNTTVEGRARNRRTEMEIIAPFVK